MKETKFKQTEVGMIPSDWEVKTLGELFDFSAGGDLQKESFSEYPSGTIKWPIYSNSLENKGLYGYTSNPRYRANCVTITGRGSLGHAEYRREAFDAIVRLLVLSPKQHVDCYFVSETINFRVPFVFESTGVPQLTAPQAAKSKIPLPPTIEEQQRIANALSDVDTLIANLEKLIAKKKNIKQGAMQQLLTGRKRLPGFGAGERTGSRPTDERRKECHSERSAKREESSGYKMTELGLIPTDWEETYLGNIGPVKMCKRVMKYQTSEKGDIPFYKIGTFGKSPDAYISKDLYHYLKNKYSFPQKGTVLISAAGTIGRTVVYDGKDAFFQDSNIVWLENDESVLTNQYLYYLYQVVEWKTENGGAVSRLYNDNFKITPIAIPSSKDEQTAIANVLSDMDTEISALETKLAKYRTLKTGMMQQLLTGKIRLV